MNGAFWTRAKVGTASGVLGLALGAGLGAAGQPTVDAKNPDVKALVSAGVDKKTATLDDQVAELRDQLDKANADAEVAAAEADHQLAAVKAHAKAAARKAAAAAAKAKAEAVRKAAAAERAKAKPAPAYGLTGSGSSGSSGGGSDPLFDTCAEANAHGYGSYREGSDPEYSHYQDRDHDGVVCE
ncbi:hypothetical protein GCM10011584_01060 [Nocardioides phosphati]|uniref:Excalibur calcium-binding domain-containing protein n=1 Tax=Nocardioides phosphati TaxID=1867775 RepID=A0ABQ2N615_9ACTN|nr:excalibur calcium-binding domain-containing protein [Nocardioides phosphati]GGO84161.1 hypothetical protein GCM10011584_01060 [Nocardioides phosphati]